MSAATPAPAADPTPPGYFGHADDEAALAEVLSQGVQRNTGAPVGTVSGPTDLPGVLDDARARDNVEHVSLTESEQEDEEGMISMENNLEHTGVTDDRYGDGRVPTEADWGLENLPETVTKSDLNFLVRWRPRNNEQEPRVDIRLVKMLGWTLQGAYVGKGYGGRICFC